MGGNPPSTDSIRQGGLLINDKAYFDVLNGIKKQIRDAQYRTVLGVNEQQILLYWNIGKTISTNVRYGNKFVETLAKDIKAEFRYNGQK
jgi:hypothetical protein